MSDASAATQSSVRGRRFSLDSMLVVDASFAVFLFAIAVLRWKVIDSLQVPSGLDGGNWLAFGHSLFGSHSRSASIVYPPVVPLVTVLLAGFLGPLKAVEVLAAVSSLAPAAGAYVLLRRFLGMPAALVAGLLAPAATTGEAAAWGGYPQLLGLGLMALLLWALTLLIDDRKARWLIATSLLLFLTVATSDLIGVAAIASTFIFVVARFLLLPRVERPSVKLIGFAAIVAIVPLLALAPTYLSLVGGVLQNEATNTSNQHLTAANVLPILNNLFKDNPAFWYLAVLAALGSPVLIMVRYSRPLAVTTAALLLPPIAALLVLRESRFFFLLPIGIATGLGACWSLFREPQRVNYRFDRIAIPIAAALLAIETILGMAAFPQQVDWYAAITPAEVTALHQLDGIAPRGASLAVSPGADQQGWPIGWWVEGLLDRPTYYASYPQWLNFQDERRRSAIANQMFSASEGLSGAVRLARANNISFIVVATQWPGYQAWFSENAPLEGARVVIENDSMLVIATSGQSGSVQRSAERLAPHPQPAAFASWAGWRTGWSKTDGVR
jgi:hypothetical protein